MRRARNSSKRKMTPEAIGERLAALYRDIEASAMRDAPICNDALRVEAIGFREFSGYALGVIVTPWFLNLFIAESSADAGPRLPTAGPLELGFPAGPVVFELRELEGWGHLGCCGLISPMFGFADQTAARAAGHATLAALFDPHLHAPAPAPARPAIDRRAFLSAWRAPQGGAP
jgi:[NiFe] hydrogenase assembly HybE family chaperone